MIGETTMSISGGFIHIPPQVREQFFDDKPRDATITPAGDCLLITIDCEPVNLALKIPLTEWTLGKPHDRKIYDAKTIHIDRWSDIIDTYHEVRGETEHVWVTVEIGAAEVSDKNYMMLTSQDGDLITHFEASSYVDEFIREYRDVRDTFQTKDVIRHSDVADRRGNVQRLHQAIVERCEVYDSNGDNGARAKRFKMPG